MSSQTKSLLFHAIGSLIQLVGWILCLASISFALVKDSELCGVLFFACVAILVAVAGAYIVARIHSEFWRTKIVRTYFSPYLLGATVWMTLMVLLTYLYRLTG